MDPIGTKTLNDFRSVMFHLETGEVAPELVIR
jgi:hypothetical protein